MTVLSPTEPSFNLWHAPWIRVLRRDGSSGELSISACLRQSVSIHALSDPSPLVVGGVHRLLAAILQWIYNPNTLDDLVGLLDVSYFPLGQLEAFEATFADRFELFHTTQPFLQAGDIPLDGKPFPREKSGRGKADADSKGLLRIDKEIKSAAKVVPQRPSGNNRTHFWHLREDRYALCPACCSRALVAMPAFARAEGRGYTYGVNPGPPLYLLPVGANLFESLTLSLLTEGYRRHADETRHMIAPWSDFDGAACEVEHVGYFEALTIPARRIRLFPDYGSDDCSLCGDHSDTLVARIYYVPGQRWKRGSKLWWQDPFVTYTPPQPKDKKQQPSGITLKPGRAIWRDYHSLLRIHDGGNQTHEQLAALWLQQLGIALIGDEMRYPASEMIRVRCIGMRVSSDAKIFEWMDEALEAPAGLLRDEGGLFTVKAMMQHADDCANSLRAVFNRNFIAKRGRAKKMKEDDREKARHCRTARERMLALYWEQLAGPFRKAVHHSGDLEERRQRSEDWARDVVKITREVFNTTVEQLGERGELLRQAAEARNDLSKELKKYERT